MVVYNPSMNDLWYPGRPPLKTPEIIEGMTLYVDTLEVCRTRQDATYVETAGRVNSAVYEILHQEGRDCLGSDTDINNMMTLLLRAQQAAEACVQRDCWEDLDDVIEAVDQVRWGLVYKLDELTEGGIDDRRTTSPQDTGRPASGSDDTEDSREEDGLVEPENSQYEVEETLQGSDGEDEENVANPTD